MSETFKLSVIMKPTDTFDSINQNLQRKYEIDEITMLGPIAGATAIYIKGRKRGFIERMVLAIKRNKK